MNGTPAGAGAAEGEADKERAVVGDVAEEGARGDARAEDVAVGPLGEEDVIDEALGRSGVIEGVERGRPVQGEGVDGGDEGAGRPNGLCRGWGPGVPAMWH